MADKFKVGDRVRLTAKNIPVGVFLEPQLAHMIGSCGEVVESRKKFGPFLRYSVTCNGEEIYPLEEALELIYDGESKSSWSECAWKPNKVKQPNGA